MGSDRKYMLLVIIYLKIMDDFVKMNEVWDNWVFEGYVLVWVCVIVDMVCEVLFVEIFVVVVEILD